MLRRRKFLIGGFLVFLAIGFLAYTGFDAAVTSYKIGDLLAQGNSIYSEDVRVKGRVTDGSLERESAGRIIRFSITDGGESLPVVYVGVVPDTFKVGGDIVVGGHLNSNGVFQAHTLMPTCPSRYEPLE